ncbi:MULTISPECIES: hypothetical protein [Methylobacterium]|uniref:hypothetical protein n=1 Tax=Methylobacterium TaxID=407 RepID=UPI0013EAEAB6|nr:hypothetical protein [Methylobacterium sp. DB0501]NGM34938.1 hypothetical protein [Methylobacterium sp. DB0501]
MLHKFKVHQQVQMVRSGSADALASDIDVFEVVRLMPEDRTGEAAYRIKSIKGERAVRESEIVALR